MKIAFNLTTTESPFGGGNSFLTFLTEVLLEFGFEVKSDLKEPDLDFIFLLDPRWRHPLSRFTAAEVSRYLMRNEKTLVVHRINECDERKNTNFMNRKLKLVNYLADSTIFVSDWLTTLDVYDQMPPEKQAFQTVIKNGSDQRFFSPDSKTTWDGNSPLKVVTHHWSSNELKGQSLYRKLDWLLQQDKWKNRIQFTYIGNLPKNSNLHNTTIIPPLDRRALGIELRKHHVYLTGSINEPGGNHQNEGGLSGLPIIFLDSGSMSEYCEGYGIKMNSEHELETALEKMMLDYGNLRDRMEFFPNTASNMASKYLTHLNSLDCSREEIIHRRKLFREPAKLLRLQFPI